MTDIKKFMQIVEMAYSNYYSGIIKTFVRDEKVHVTYEIDHGDVDYYIEELGIEGTRALNLTSEESEDIQRECIYDMDMSLDH